jgi:hypothetical protein
MPSASSSPAMRRPISSSDTSSTRVWSHQTLPNGSRIRLPRTPHTLVESGVSSVAPAASAARCVASQSSTHSVRKLGVSHQSGRASKVITTDVPIRISPCPIVPSPFGTRPRSTAPKASTVKSMNAPAPFTTTYGVTEW